MIFERGEAVTHLDTSARQDALKGRKGRLSCAGLDPCYHRLGHARSFRKLALSQLRPSAGETDEVCCNFASSTNIHKVMIPEAVSTPVFLQVAVRPSDCPLLNRPAAARRRRVPDECTQLRLP